MAQIGWQHLQACHHVLDQGGPTQQIELEEVCREASLQRHPLRGGGIARREQALRVWICARLRALSSCKGAQKALMYLFTPSSDSSM